MEVEAPALGWVRDRLEPATQDAPPRTSGPEPAPAAGGPELRTTCYETQVKEAEPTGPYVPGLALQLTLVDGKHLSVFLGGTELATEDVTVTAPGDRLKVDLHLSPDTCARDGRLYRAGSLLFGESGAGFSGTVYGTCGGDSRELVVVGRPVPRARLSLDDLLTMQDGGDAHTARPEQPSVRRKVREWFGQRLKASPSVRSVFFGNASSTVSVPDSAWVNSIAVALICTAVGELSIRNFRQLVDTAAASRYLDVQFTSPQAMACGQALYDAAYEQFAMSARGVPFSEYWLLRGEWGRKLSNWLQGQTFLTAIGARFATGDAPDTSKMLNRALYLLQRLGVTGAEIEAVRGRFATFAQWVRDEPRHYLNRIDYPNAAFGAEVIAAAVQQRTDHYSLGQGMGGWTTYYGEQLVQFLNSQAGSFRTSVHADDRESKTTASSMFCFISGTPIQLADGRQVPVESVQPGERVLAGDGSVTIRADEEIVFAGSPQEALYGINDMAPFFTGGHMLLTTRGWRAIDPEAPRRENPGIEVGTLQVGDKVIRLASFSPFRVDEMEVHSISRRMLTTESRVHGLKLEGEQTYFAHGIGVSASYPKLTEARIAECIRSLPDGERAALLRTLGPVMPLLVEALRDFAGPRLLEALGVQLEEGTA